VAHGVRRTGACRSGAWRMGHSASHPGLRRALRPRRRAARELFCGHPRRPRGGQRHSGGCEQRSAVMALPGGPSWAGAAAATAAAPPAPAAPHPPRPRASSRPPCVPPPPPPCQSDLTLGKKLGSGAFGSVFRATLAPEREGEAPLDVIVKKVRGLHVSRGSPRSGGCTFPCCLGGNSILFVVVCPPFPVFISVFCFFLPVFAISVSCFSSSFLSGPSQMAGLCAAVVESGPAWRCAAPPFPPTPQGALGGPPSNDSPLFKNN
jgi:hypothetical protein